MAYYNGFPASYQPYYSQYQQTMYQNQQNPQSCFIRVQNENDAKMYPVAPGNSVVFLDENAPYCYTKTVFASQLDRPKFEKYRLVKEDENTTTDTQYSNAQTQTDLSMFALKTDVALEIKRLEEKMQSMLRIDGEQAQ